MKRTLLAVAVIAASASLNLGAATAINGSGATFPAPLYLRWASDFKKSNPDITVNYQGIGSGAGVTQFVQGITDFGASDVAMKDEEILQARTAAGGRTVMIPATAGSIVLAYNVPGVQTGLKLTRAAYIGILCGDIKTWNAPEIAKAKDNSWDAKLKAERHRKLKLENDETEKTLIKREWMAERVHLAAGKVDAFRQKSEAEHPLLFAAAAGDVAACRAVVRKIWDEVMASLNTLEKDFRE